MRIAVFGDISSDYPGLVRFFDQAARDQVDKYVCLGDIVHHNSPRGIRETDACIKILQEHETQTIFGNHDTRLLEENPGWLSSDVQTYLEALPKEIILGEALFVHESPSGRFTAHLRQSEFDHFLENYPEQRIAFFGHSHKRLHFSRIDGETHADYLLFATARKLFDKPHDISQGLHLINPGTIDGAKFPWGFNECPSYVLYDTEQQTAYFKRIPK
jgi:predicted phosphodiesterase